MLLHNELQYAIAITTPTMFLQIAEHVFSKIAEHDFSKRYRRTCYLQIVEHFSRLESNIFSFMFSLVTTQSLISPYTCTGSVLDVMDYGPAKAIGISSRPTVWTLFELRIIALGLKL